MKYKCETIIKAPINLVAELWNNSAFFQEWQDGFQSITLVEGKQNQIGSKSQIVLEDKMRIELIETIITCDLPTEKKALYEHEHMTNTQLTRFEDLGNGQTRFISEVEYVQFNGLMIKLMAKLFPSKFKAQSQKWMDQFKVFAEKKLN